MRWRAKVNPAGVFRGLLRLNLSNCGYILSAKCSIDASYNLVDRRYGIQEVRGSNPLGSTILSSEPTLGGSERSMVSSVASGRVAQIDFGDGGARLCEPQHVQQFENPWNFLRPFGTPGYCGSQTRAPFHLGNTPLGEGGLFAISSELRMAGQQQSRRISCGIKLNRLTRLLQSGWFWQRTTSESVGHKVFGRTRPVTSLRTQ